MSNYKENIKFRTEAGRELRNTEVDSNFKYVANPWSPLRIYEKGMIVYYKVEDEVTSNIALTHWFIAKKRTTRGFFIIDEWEIMSGWDSSIINTSENAFSRIIVNSNLNGSYSSASNGIIEAASVQASLGFVAGAGINLEFDDTNNLIKISRGFGGGEANTAINIGTGIGVFRDKIDFDLNLRSLKSSSSLLDISLDGSDEIEFNIDTSLIHLSDIGNKVLNDLDNVNATPTLNQVLSWNGTQWVASTIASSIYTASNLGSGSASVFSNIVANDFKFRRIKSDTAAIGIMQDANYITFDFMPDQVPIGDIRHIEINNPQEGEILIYNLTDTRWENKLLLNIYNSDGNIMSNRVVDLNGNFLQYSDSTISTGIEPYFHVEAAPGFLKFVGEAPVPSVLEGYFSGDLFLQSDERFINGIYEYSNNAFHNVLGFQDLNNSIYLTINTIEYKLKYENIELVNTTVYNEDGITYEIDGINGKTNIIFDKFGNFGINTLTPLHSLHVINDTTGQDAAYFEGDVTVDGKLNVTGLIDPTGLVLNEQATSPYATSTEEGLLWVGNNGEKQTLYFKDEDGTEYDLLLNYEIIHSDTYSNLKNLADTGELIAGKYYLMTDYQTIYDQLDFASNGALKGSLTLKTETTEPIILLALTNSKFDTIVYSTIHEKDKIKYDININTTNISSSSCKGRIIERIDEWNNRTNYDHRTIKFIRYSDGDGRFMIINDNGNSSDEFLTFGIHYGTGGNIENNYISGGIDNINYYTNIYGNNVFHGTIIVEFMITGTFINNSIFDDSEDNIFSGKFIRNNVYDKLSNNSFTGAIANSKFESLFSCNVGGKLSGNTFSSAVENTDINCQLTNNYFIGEISNCLFSGYLVGNNIEVALTTCQFNATILNTTIEYITGGSEELIFTELTGNISNKILSSASYANLFSTNTSKKILQDINGDIYYRYFDSPNYQFVLIS